MGLKEAFGNRVRELRDRQGITQEVLAERTQRAVDTLSLIERGVNWPSVDTIERIAEALNVTTRELFNDLEADGDDTLVMSRRMLESMSADQRELAVQLLQVVVKRP